MSGDELGVINVHVTDFVLWTIRSTLGAKSGDVANNLYYILGESEKNVRIREKNQSKGFEILT